MTNIKSRNIGFLFWRGVMNLIVAGQSLGVRSDHRSDDYVLTWFANNLGIVTKIKNVVFFDLSFQIWRFRNIFAVVVSAIKSVLVIFTYCIAEIWFFHTSSIIKWNVYKIRNLLPCCYLFTIAQEFKCGPPTHP